MPSTKQKKNRNVKQGLTKQIDQLRETGIKLRQARRHDQVNKRRRGEEEASLQPKEEFETRYANEKIRRLILAASSSLSSARMATDLSEHEGPTKGVALTQLRLLFLDENVPVSRFINAGIMPVFTQILNETAETKTDDDNTNLVEYQYEVLWCLTNIACDAYEYTKQVFLLAPRMIEFLRRGHAQLQEQSAWCLANLAGEDFELRQQLFGMGVVPPLAALLASERNKTVRLAAWALVNLMKGPTFPVDVFLEADVIKLVGPHLSSNDDALLTEVLWILAGLTEAHERCANLIYAAGLLQGLVTIVVNQSNPLVVMPALRTLAPVIRIKATELGAVVSNVVPMLVQNLQNFHVGVTKETAVALAAFACEPSLLPHLTSVIPSACVLFTRTRFDIRKELAFLLLKLASCSRDDVSSSSTPVSFSSSPSSSRFPSLMHIVSVSGVVDTFLDLLKSSDVDANLSALNFVELVLRFVPQGVELIEEKQGIEVLESFQTSQNDQLYDFARQLVDEFYGESYGVADEVQKPDESQGYPSWRRQADESTQIHF